MPPDIVAMRDAGRPRSTCYWMTGHLGTERVDPIAGDVRAVRRDSRGRYGARKIKAALERKGVTASRRRIGGIMHEQGMTSAYTRRRFKPHGTRVNEAKLANLLDREFDGTPRTRIWRAILPMSASADRLLKKELVYRNHYTTIEQPRHDPDDCVWWSDAQRLHSALGYRSPKEFTEQGLVL